MEDQKLPEREKLKSKHSVKPGSKGETCFRHGSFTEKRSPRHFQDGIKFADIGSYNLHSLHVSQSSIQQKNKMRLITHVSCGSHLHTPICCQSFSGHNKNGDSSRFRKDAASSVIIEKKWVPVGRKKSPMPADICNRVNDTRFRIRSAPAVLTDNKNNTSLISSNDVITAVLKRALQIETCSEMIDQSLVAAYTLQLASEDFGVKTGCILSRFERFIHCVAPSIPSSYNYEKCSICFGDQISYTLLCKHQIPNIPLRDFWSWYEVPGNYGLEFKAENSTSFYFSPTLSAIQLFGYSHPSNCEVDLHNPYSTRGKTLSDAPVSVSPINNCELVFEFFESDKPHERMTIYNKIKELASAGTSNPQLLGDASKLESLSLNDLHPASWFSVHWYPIYQIPEGKFRASFLTFHSLGHLVHKRASILCPALGLQSHNAEDEGWFAQASNILKEHLKTLEENSPLFARGCVCKNNTIVRNWQWDYEFFASRKR